MEKRFKEAPDPLKELKAYHAQTQSVLQVIDREASARRTLDVAVRAFDATSGAIYLGSVEDKPIYTVGEWKAANGWMPARKLWALIRRVGAHSIQELIRREFQVLYNRNYVCELLHNLGYSLQKAQFVLDHLDTLPNLCRCSNRSSAHSHNLLSAPRMS